MAGDVSLLQSLEAGLSNGSSQCCGLPGRLALCHLRDNLRQPSVVCIALSHSCQHFAFSQLVTVQRAHRDVVAHVRSRVTGGALLPVLHGMSEVPVRSWAECHILSPSCLARAGYHDVAGDVGLLQSIEAHFSNCTSPRCALPGEPSLTQLYMLDSRGWPAFT